MPGSTTKGMAGERFLRKTLNILIFNNKRYVQVVLPGMNLKTPVTQISRVGKTTAGKLKVLGIATAEDLLFYFPFRYDDFSRPTAISDLQAGQRVNVVGQVELIGAKRSFARRLSVTEALVSDHSGMLRVVWFNQPFIAGNLQSGDRVSLAGKVEEDVGGLVLKSAVYEKLSGSVRALHTQGLVPNYRLTANLTQKQLRWLISQVIGLAAKVEDWLPLFIRQEFDLLPLHQAIRQSHFPQNKLWAARAKQRLSFDELFLLQLEAQLIRGQTAKQQAQPIVFHQAATKQLVAKLPFKLTTDQRRAAWQIIKDLEKSQPMLRLLVGDVGSGKTVVALVAMFNVVKNGYQAALLAPTEVLARQHFNSLSNLLSGVNLKIGLFTRIDKKIYPTSDIRNPISENQLVEQTKQKKTTVDYLMKNADIIIGTHALIQEKINFKNLVLAVVDEQHRFGVAQRQALTGKGSDLTPHLLSMTATPIPRSLALALYDDLAIAEIKEMPERRLPIITKLVTDSDRQVTYDFIRQEIRAGRQCFVICPLIDESDVLGARSVKVEYEKLKQNIFPELTVGLLHGKLKARDKEKVMQDFVANKINILVATAVVEVGIDVPNATVMLVESAERFGLAQLHQYRGRVGRGEHQSYCFLLADLPASETTARQENTGEKARERLAAMLQFNSGFALAKEDLKFRGPGEVYGTLQKGFPELKVADLFDFVLMKKAKEAAKKTLNLSPDLKKFGQLKAKLGDWQKMTHLE